MHIAHFKCPSLQTQFPQTWSVFVANLHWNMLVVGATWTKETWENNTPDLQQVHSVSLVLHMRIWLALSTHGKQPNYSEQSPRAIIRHCTAAFVCVFLFVCATYVHVCVVLCVTYERVFVVLCVWRMCTISSVIQNFSPFVNPGWLYVTEMHSDLHH